LRKFRSYTALSLGFLLLASVLTFPVIGQKVEAADSLAEVNRIDSLTKELYLDLSQYDPNWISSTVKRDDNQDFTKKMNCLGSSIQYEYNTYVAGQISHMSYANFKYLKAMTGKSETYFSVFEPILDKYGLPNEMKYLSVIESGLNPEARSRVGATGLWQFMPGTGRLMEMSVNGECDERCNITVSTEKASQYLLSMYERFGDWLLALAAYNAGPGNVNSAIRRSGSKDFWKVQRYLPGETKKYVPRFMATVYLMEFVIPETFQIQSSATLMVKLEVNKNVHLKHIAAHLPISLDSLKKLNPMYRKDIIDMNNAKGDLFLPYELAMIYKGKEEEIYLVSENSLHNNLSTIAKTKTVWYKVKRGEGMRQIARKFGCSSYEIKKWNKMRNYRVYPGKSLKIKKTILVPSGEMPEDGVYYYVTENTESVLSICKKYNYLDKNYILTQNNITSENEIIEEGKVLQVYLGKFEAAVE
jgi:membrane-bound lytic murein transglycosylase D